jgi:excisionase family DNA binding protein
VRASGVAGGQPRRREQRQCGHPRPEGRAASVANADDELTTWETAKLLNVSRPHFTQLLKEGGLPSYKVEAHHASTCGTRRPTRPVEQEANVA